MRADVSKRGVVDGNQKMGTLSSPQKRATSIIIKDVQESKYYCGKRERQ